MATFDYQVYRFTGIKGGWQPVGSARTITAAIAFCAVCERVNGHQWSYRVCPAR